jgi:hypothetical protein
MDELDALAKARGINGALSRQLVNTKLLSLYRFSSATQTPGKGLGRNLIAQRSRSGVGNLSRPSMAVSCADEQSS